MVYFETKRFYMKNPFIQSVLWMSALFIITILGGSELKLIILFACVMAYTWGHEVGFTDDGRELWFLFCCSLGSEFVVVLGQVVSQRILHAQRSFPYLENVHLFALCFFVGVGVTTTKRKEWRFP